MSVNERAFREWMAAQVSWAAIQLRVRVTGQIVWGWSSRSASQPARAGTHDVWLRVGTEQQRHLPHACWTGLPSANAVRGVRKPVVLASVEQDTSYDDVPRKVRADLMTRLTGTPCSAGEILRSAPDLPEEWWRDLRSAYATIRTTPNPREVGSAAVSAKARRMCGNGTAERMAVTAWETAHGDFHWAQLLRPRLGILDWEMWGRMPVGTDPAVLYCTALLVPSVAERVWHTFADVLETPHGRIALFRSAITLLSRTSREYTDLEAPLRSIIDYTPDHSGH